MFLDSSLRLDENIYINLKNLSTFVIKCLLNDRETDTILYLYGYIFYLVNNTYFCEFS